MLLAKKMQKDWENLFWRKLKDYRYNPFEPTRNYPGENFHYKERIKKLEDLEIKVKELSKEILSLGGKSDTRYHIGENKISASCVLLIQEITQLKEEAKSTLDFTEFIDSQIKQAHGPEASVPRFIAELLLAGFMVHEKSNEGRLEFYSFFLPEGTFYTAYNDYINPEYESKKGIRRGNTHPKTENMFETLLVKLIPGEYLPEMAGTEIRPENEFEKMTLWESRVKRNLKRNISFFRNSVKKEDELSEEEKKEISFSNNRIEDYVLELLKQEL